MSLPDPIQQAPKAFSAIVSAVNGLIRYARPWANVQGKNGITVTASDTNVIIDAGGLEDRLGEVEELRQFRHPFQVLPYDLTDPAAPKVRINASSRLYTGIATTGAAPISGLTSDITLASNTHVWIQVGVTSLSFVSVSIQTGTAWPALVTTSGSPAVQSQFCVPIGRVVASDSTKPGFEFVLSGTTYHFEQCLFNHLLIENRCNSGVPIIYAFPWGGAA